ncbi:MAG: DtxR family transcriptional regulator [Acidimicrobiia bacterium]
MTDDIRTTTESEEMFLITVARAVEDGHPEPVPAPRIAEALEITRVSVNETVKKLVARGMIEYEPYRGITLTPAGTAVANRVLRRRRLWALFLNEHLGIDPAEADAVACEFEHVTPADVEGRLATFLGDPTVDPEGKPIPASGSSIQPIRSELTIPDLGVGQRVRVKRVAGDPAIRSFLADEGIDAGTVVTVLAIGSDRGALVDTGTGHVHLSAQVAADVVVGIEPD